MTVKPTLAVAFLAGIVLPSYATEKGIEPLKNELEQIKQDYTDKIQSLERRLDAAELANEDVTESANALAIEISQQANRNADNTFNPAIGVVLNGKYLSQSPSDTTFSIPGFFLGEEPGPGEPGLALGESELNLSANIDDKFYGRVTLAFGEETEVEEAFLQTTALPSGLRMRFGRFFSDVGYLNSHHSHTDDFAYRPLAQQAFLGNHFGDDGVQLSWLAPTPLYWESGIELYRGESFPASGASHQGKGAATAYSHIGGDIGTHQSWRTGISFLAADVVERSSDEDGGELFNGDSDLWIADVIWKWAPNGNTQYTYATVQGEYYRRSEIGEFTDRDNLTLPLNSDQSGWYLQGVFQFMPQWRIGLRYERVEADDLPIDFDGTVLDNLSHSPKQTSLMVDWSNSEFSRLRLQYSHDQSSPINTDLWTLQYIAAFGAHGAHSF